MFPHAVVRCVLFKEGISRMQEAMNEANLHEPEFHTDEMFTTVFKRTVYNATTGGVNGGVNLAISNEASKGIAEIANFEWALS